MSYRDHKNNKLAAFEKIAKQFSSTGGFEEDTRFWYPDVDKAGNGLAVIRFLPAFDGEDSPTIKLYKRSFQGPTGKWYIENDLSTIGKPDPVKDLNDRLCGGLAWAEVPKNIKDIVSKQKRKEQHISNIYVVKDPAHPENEGKVFLFRYGKKIRGMISEKMNPTFEGEERVNPFDMDEGAALKIKIVKQDGYRNYDKSEWMTPGPIVAKKDGSPDDEAQEAIYNQIYPLAPFLAADQFGTYESLQAKLNAVVGNAGRVQIDVSDDEAEASPFKEASPRSTPSVSDDSEDEIDDAFFKQLEDEDA